MPRNLPARRRWRISVNAATLRTGLSRRVFLGALARLSLAGGVVMANCRAFAARRQPRAPADIPLTLSAVIDHMLPADELPGALALGIDGQVVLAADPDLKRDVTPGVAWLDAQARAAGAARFVHLDKAAREAVLQAALASEAHQVAAFVRGLRTRAFTHYYTHPTVMAAFAYTGPPQPEGFPDFQEPPR